MPVVSPGTIRPPSTQSDVGQMIGEIQLWRPDIGPQYALSFLNNALRKVVDYRSWYGLTVHGEIVSPDIYTTGSVATTADSPIVTGTGTVWDATMVGRQFRVGMTLSVYTIKSVDSPTQITLDLPWGGTTMSAVGYQIVQSIYSFGPKIRRILAVVNKRQNWRLQLDWSQERLNVLDPQRARIGWTWAVASHSPKDGEPRWELYPWPTSRQAFPFLAYSQPDDLVDDADTPPTFIRSDVIVLGALSDALRARKGTQYYDPDTALHKERQFQQEIMKMARMDDALAMQDLQYEYFNLPIGGPDFEQANVLPPDVGVTW